LRPAHRLVSVALILTSRWTAVSCYAALRSPDLPPAPPEGGASGDLARFTVGIIGERFIGATLRLVRFPSNSQGARNE
jgi:hypothetical protein